MRWANLWRDFWSNFFHDGNGNYANHPAAAPALSFLLKRQDTAVTQTNKGRW
jgi:hypothetical protein